MLAKIHVTYKEGVLDPQGQAVHHALTDLGYNEVNQVTVGKYMEVHMADLSEDEAQVRVKEMCEKLLANTVIESYQITLSPTE
jgi:phosphoribosylformylglycinamidine synthase PurS subunit